MTTGFTSYAAYKDSGVPWLGQVPGHWERRKLRNVLRPVTVRNRPDLPLLSVVREKGVILRDVTNKDENHNFIPEDLTNYKVVHKGQFAINKMKAWQGSNGVSQHNGIVSPAYFVFNLNGASGDFFHAAIRSQAYVPLFTRASDGVRIGQWDLSLTQMREIPFFIPPPEEQQAIVRYLKVMDRRIKRFIQNRQRLIEVLNEQKQAIINHAVTKGLDPNVKLKPSGVEWLGDIPEHWEAKPAKRLYREIDQRSPDGTEELLSVSHLTGVTPRSQKNITMFMAESYAGHKICQPGDLVINTMWAWMGALGISCRKGIVSPSYAVYRPLKGSRLAGEYADLLLRTVPYVSEFACRSTGIRSSRLRLYPDTFLRIPIICPPLEEQRTLTDHISRATYQLNHAREQTEKEIALIREYQTRLIADVVTGKVDIRRAAQSLRSYEAEGDEQPEENDLPMAAEANPLYGSDGMDKPNLLESTGHL
ncbi:MAG: restriction endonuclease subunit S [Candidatus Pacebacteria bacterium]|nr:restriction endonuclease subunit S [Candidatus Paceibacterota bacterium]